MQGIDGVVIFLLAFVDARWPVLAFNLVLICLLYFYSRIFRRLYSNLDAIHEVERQAADNCKSGQCNVVSARNTALAWLSVIRDACDDRGSRLRSAASAIIIGVFAQVAIFCFAYFAVVLRIISDKSNVNAWDFVAPLMTSVPAFFALTTGYWFRRRLRVICP